MSAPDIVAQPCPWCEEFEGEAAGQRYVRLDHYREAVEMVRHLFGEDDKSIPDTVGVVGDCRRILAKGDELMKEDGND